jgi:hydrogenase nickel incorporation protein HypB
MAGRRYGQDTNEETTMCTTCGCGAGETRIEGQAVPPEHAGDPHWHVHADGTAHSHDHAADGHAHEHGNEHAHAHAHVHEHADGTVHSHPHDHAGEHHHHHHAAHHEHVHSHADGTVHSHGHTHEDTHFHDHPAAHAHVHAGQFERDAHHYGHGPAGAHAPGMTQARMVQIEQDILGKNDALAAANRRWLGGRGILALNLVSSPGSGKTTLLVRTIGELAGEKVAVIEGDQQTAFDAQRIRATGAPAIQINTGKGCHLDADMVGRALQSLSPAEDSVLFIENVGNLVCPAAFDLGEAAKVAILSVTEGEDKPLKYPDMFRAARLMLLNKVDLLPWVSFDVAKAVDAARRVNPQIEVIEVSATRGDGLSAWLAWLAARRAELRRARESEVEALRRRVAELEAQLARGA